jgi:hypothetical protein
MLLKKVLLVTYHFPPSAASGAFRLLGFARHLPDCGWQPVVVAPPSLPWEPVDPALAEGIPEEAIVERVPYPSRAPRLVRKFAQNAVWLPYAWAACKRLVAEHRPDAVLTSGPPHCVHLVGRWLKQKFDLPWLADFRDPWISDGRMESFGWTEHLILRWERRVFAEADVVLANAPNACRLFQQTYPDHANKIMTLTNGFDPRPGRNVATVELGSSVRLLHAGEIYAGRDPGPLLEALAQLNQEDRARAYHCDVLGRVEGNALADERWLDLLSAHGQLPYEDTLDAMERADILVLFDSPGRTIGVPAKLYEYLGAGRPILALAEANGDVANVLRQSGVLHRIASPRDSQAIASALRGIVGALDRGAPVAQAGRLERFTRARLTQSLARRMDALLGEPVATRGASQEVNA